MRNIVFGRRLKLAAAKRTDGTAIDERREHSEAIAEDLAHRAHAEHDVEIRSYASYSHANVKPNDKQWITPHINNEMLRGVRTPPLPHPQTFDCHELFNSFFWVCSKYAPIVWKILRNSDLLHRHGYFEKTLFYPTSTYPSLCSSECTCVKILFLVENSCEVVIYTHKRWWVRRPTAKLWKTFWNSRIYWQAWCSIRWRFPLKVNSQIALTR